MRSLLSRRPSPALVVACLALAIALGGTAYAQVAVPRNSVGTPQLKNGAVTAPKIGLAAVGRRNLARNAVSTLNVANRSLLAADFAPGELPAGEPGPAGPAGAAGPTGPAGPAGTSGLQIVQAVTSEIDTDEHTVGASCPSGKRALGGGAQLAGPGARNGAALIATYPSSDTGWTAEAYENDTNVEPWSLRVWVVCATVGA